MNRPVGAGGGIRYCSSVSRIKVESSSLEFQDLNMNRTTNYEWRHKKGKVLIINNTFRHQADDYRIGSEIDVKNMDTLWKAFGCDVSVFQDLTVREMRPRIDEFIRQCQECDYCVVFIMSHGGCSQNVDYVYGNDNGEMPFGEIKRLFHNDHAPCLRGIPKLLFFQCCRTDPSIPENTTARSLSRVEADSGPIIDHIPKCSDMLIACATQQGSQAWRNSHRGSWFINAIANVFMQDAQNEHVADMMTKVNNAVAEKASAVGSEQVCVSMPVYEVTFRKKLYLYPGLTGSHTH